MQRPVEQLHVSPVIVLFIIATGHRHLTATQNSHDCYYFGFFKWERWALQGREFLGTQDNKGEARNQIHVCFLFNLNAFLPLCKWYRTAWCIRKGISWVNLDKIEPPGCGLITLNNQEYALVVVTLNFNGYGHSPCPLSGYEASWLQTDLTWAKNAPVIERYQHCSSEVGIRVQNKPGSEEKCRVLTDYPLLCERCAILSFSSSSCCLHTGG